MTQPHWLNVVGEIALGAALIAGAVTFMCWLVELGAGL